MEGLIEGRSVHYVMPDGEHRPAIVVKVWDVTGCEGYCNLQVFTDGSNDLNDKNKEFIAQEDIRAGICWRTSVCYGEDAAPNTWHWIERA